MIPSALSVADGLTKPLANDAFNAFREMLRGLNGLNVADGLTNSLENLEAESSYASLILSLRSKPRQIPD
jgi:hypothetical protein